MGLDRASTDARVYWLVAGTKASKRITLAQGKGGPPAAGQQVSVRGFTGQNVRVVDVTDSAAVQEIAAAVTADKSGYIATVTAGGTGDWLLLMFADAQAGHPLTVTANIPSSLRQAANGADLLILTQRSFFAAVEPLKAQRQKEGLSVAVIDIEDIRRRPQTSTPVAPGS